MKKKGAMEYAITPFKIVLATFFMILIVTAIVNIANSISIIEKCHTSVVAASTFKKYVTGGKSLADIDCPKVDYKIDTEDIGRYDEERIKNFFAERMRWCWYKMGEGLAEPFSEQLLDRNTVCVICSEVEFDEKYHDEEPVSGLFEYMEATEIPGQERKYMDYVSKNLVSTSFGLFGLFGANINRNTLSTESGFLDSFTNGEIDFWVLGADGPVDIEIGENQLKKVAIDPKEKYYVTYVIKSKDSIESGNLFTPFQYIMSKFKNLFIEMKSVPGIFIVTKEKFRILSCEDVYQ